MNRLLTVAALSALLFSSVGLAQTKSKVFVEDVGVAKGVDMDSRALTSGLCAALMKQKGVDVVCAPDVRQLLDFQSQLALIGKSPAIAKLESQVQETPFVISSVVTRENKMIKLSVGLHEKGAVSEGVFLTAGKRVNVVHERVKTASKLLGRVDTIAEQLAKTIIRGPVKVKAPDPEPEAELSE